MQQSRELPLPSELQALIKEYESDKVGIHPTAHLIKKLKFIPTDNLSVVKIILAAYAEDEYFVVLRDTGVTWDYVRSYNLEYLKYMGFPHVRYGNIILKLPT